MLRIGRGAWYLGGLIGLLLLTACGESPALFGPLAGTPTTAVPATPTAAAVTPRAVTFTTADGVTLSGTAYGQGATAVIFSHMSDGSRAEWRDLPEQLAARGYRTLAYDFRGRGESEGTFAPDKADTDLRAAVAFMRQKGATDLALVGASMGAMASAKVAATDPPAALVLLTGTTSWNGLTVSDAEMAAIVAPKLVISSEQDGYLAGTLHLYDAAAPPKEKHIYPGGAHGTQLFDVYGDDLTARIVGFVTTRAPR
jgi:pimeloyl-ACP methyl ester carboxylesterase